MSSIQAGARLPAWSKIVVFLSLSGILGSIAAITYVSLETRRMAELAPNPKYVAALAKKIVELPEPLPEGFEYQVGMDMNFLRLVSLINRKAMQQYTIYDFPGTTNQKARKFTEDAYAYGMNTPSVVGKFTELNTLVFDRTARLYKQDDYYYSGSKPANSSVLSYNKLEECQDSFMIPKCFYHLKKLEKLTISNYQLDTLLSDIGNLSSLKYLSIIGRDGMVMPSEISKLDKLDTLILPSSFVMDSNLVLPSIKYFSTRTANLPIMPAAKFIELTCFELPKSIFYSKQLEVIKITLDNSGGGYFEGGNPDPYDWPTFFTRLQEFPNLKELTISLNVGKADGGSHVYDIIQFKDVLLKCKNLKKLKYLNYEYEDKSLLAEAFPNLIIE